MALTKIKSGIASNTFVTDRLGYTPANKAGDTFTGDLGTSGNLVYRQKKYDDSSNSPIPSEDSYRQFNGLNFKNLGMFQFRNGADYLHLKTNMTGDNIMFQVYAHGYLYNSGNLLGIHGGYTYQGGIINQFTQTQGNCGFSGSYRGAGGNLCLRLYRGSSGYSEGYVTVYWHAFDATLHNPCSIIAYAQNTNAGSAF